MAALILVTAAPGRSGADTLMAALTCHPQIATSAALTPALLGAAYSLTVYGDSESDCYLPRRTAQALTDVIVRLQNSGERGVLAAARLLRTTEARPVSIPAYGELYLPDERPRSWWLRAVRSLISDLAPPGTRVIIAKSGPVNPPGVARLVGPGDRHVYVVRHPATLASTLSESVVDGMRAEDATDLIELTLTEAVSMHANLATSTMVVRLEDLCSDPRRVLSTVLSGMAVDEPTGGATWMSSAAAGIPKDVALPLDQEWVYGPSHPGIPAVATKWGYR